MKPCAVCGTLFYGGPDRFYCPDCAQAKKSGSTLRSRSCQDCGVKFLGGPRAKRCLGCAHKAQLESGRRHKKNGTKRPLGSIDKCVICGNEYAVVSGRQKYCSDACQRIGLLDWQRDHKEGYHKTSGQDTKKQARREQSKKICAYCLRPFSSSSSTNTCSAYCRAEHRKFLQCAADIRRGKNRCLEKYEEKRETYREECRNDR